MRKALNVGGILTGLALGQGALFVLNTYLVSEGLLALVGQIGLSLGFLSLFLWVIDFGGVYYLTRSVVEGDYRVKWWQVILGRLFIGVPVSIFSAILLATVFHDSFEAQIVLTAIVIAAPIWALNILGLLEGKDLAGLGGLFNNLGTLFAAIYISYILSRGEHFEGVFIGLAFALGVVVTVVAHYTIAYFKLRMISLGSNEWAPRMAFIVPFLRFGLGYSVSHLPAQAYSRIVLLLINQTLGAAVGGVYVYIKTVMNACAQVVNSIRRVEFRELVSKIGRTRVTYWNALTQQTSSVYFSFAVVGITLVLSIQYAPDSEYHLIIEYLPIFSAVFAFWVIASGGGNYLIAQNKVFYYARLNAIISAATLIIIWTLIGYYGLWMIAVAEIAMHVVQVVAYGRSVKETY